MILQTQLQKEVDDIMATLNTELKSVINDEITSSITTYSSTKIVNMFENQVIASKYETEKSKQRWSMALRRIKWR